MFEYFRTGGNRWLRLASICLCVLCALVLIFFLLPARQPPRVPSAAVKLALQVNLGFQGVYREDYWTPAQITIANQGANFNGTLAVQVFSGPNASPGLIGSTAPWSYETAIQLPQRATKQFTLTIPFYLGNLIPRGFLATVRDEQGRIVATSDNVSSQNVSPYEVKVGNLFLGLLADPNADFTALNQATLPNQTSSLTPVFLDARTLPATDAVLENFDVIVLDTFESRSLSPAQWLALRTWVNRGGMLVEVGGTGWQETLGSVPNDLLPVTVHGLTTLPSGTHLFPAGSAIVTPTSQFAPPPDRLAAALPISTATVRGSTGAFSTPETLLAAGTTPLIVQAHQGAGVLCYLAFDPASAPLAAWPTMSALWRTVIFRAMGDHFLVSNVVGGYDSGPGQLLTRGGILSLLEPTTPFGPWIILVLFIGYLLVLGPVRLLILRHWKLATWWSWRLFVASIVIFSLLSYGLALYQKGAAMTNNNISLIQVNQDGSSAHVTDYMGIYTPDDGDVALHIPTPDNNQANDQASKQSNMSTQTLAQLFLQNNLAITTASNANMDVSTTTLTSPTQTDLTMHAVRLWTFHPVVTERDRQLPGAITTHLQLRSGKLVGTITNTLTSSLSDVYVLLPHSIVPIGSIAARTTQQINLALQSMPPDSGRLLADQIAAQEGFPSAYFPYLNGKQPTSTSGQHTAVLSALDGVGIVSSPCDGPCLSHAVINRSIIYPTGGKTPAPNYHNNYDPLLIDGAAATLIGWADQGLPGVDEVTINGKRPAGVHMSLLQMPLNLELAGSLQAPPDFIGAQTIDMSYDAQMTLPGIYSLSTGYVTFSLAVPQTGANGLSVTIPDLTTSPSGTPSSTITGSLLVQCYNWRSGSWENVKLTGNTFPIRDRATYAGPTGNILIQVANRNTQPSAPPIFFSRPFLSLHGSA